MKVLLLLLFLTSDSQARLSEEKNELIPSVNTMRKGKPPKSNYCLDNLGGYLTTNTGERLTCG